MKKQTKIITSVLLLLLLVVGVVGATPSYTYLSDSVSWFKDKVGIGTDSPSAELEVENSDTDTAVLIDQDGNGVSLEILADSTNNGLNLNQNGVLASTSSALQVYSGAAQTTSGRGLFRVRQDNAGSTQDATEILNDGTGNGLLIDQNGNGESLRIESGATSVSVIESYANEVFTGTGYNSAHRFSLNNVASTGTVTEIRNEGTGNGLLIDQNGNGVGLYIDSEATNNPALELNVDGTKSYARFGNTADSEGTFWLYRNALSSETTDPVTLIEQDNVGDDQNALNIQNDGTGDGLFIDQNGEGKGIQIDSEATTKAAINFFGGGQHGGCSSGQYGLYTDASSDLYYCKNGVSTKLN
jgi:hypothetical protein